VSIVDPVPLMVKYLDGKEKLSNEEKEILIFALYTESLTALNLTCPSLAREARNRLTGVSAPEPQKEGR